MVFLFFFVGNATSRDSNANSTAHKMGNSEENAQRSEQSRYLRSTDQEACRIVPLSQALRSPSQNFRTMRHIPEALKSEEGEGEISRRCPKNGNPMALPTMCLGGICSRVCICRRTPRKHSINNEKTAHFGTVL